MAIRNTELGGTDWTSEELKSVDLNDTFDATINGGMLGEVKMFALSISGSITKSNLQGKGWAICDGTTPASQGISAPDITASTPNLENRFIRGSDNETSGTTGGTSDHNHQWSFDTNSTPSQTWESNGTTKKNMPSAGIGNMGSAAAAISINANARDCDLWTNDASTLPSYYELVFFMKVKVVN